MQTHNEAAVSKDNVYLAAQVFPCGIKGFYCFCTLFKIIAINFPAIVCSLFVLDNVSFCGPVPSKYQRFKVAEYASS